jgi:CMP-N,N'-diacetyllegionaminic acid synthase
MRSSFKVLGIIPARGGSKGIPRKNIAPLNGRPLLEYTAITALQSKGLARVVLSTDDPEIAAVGRNCGLEVPFLRPSHLAEDSTATIPVLQDVVTRLASEGSYFDAVFILQPTNPLRRVSDIDGAIDLLKASLADSVISFTPVGDRHPARMKMINALGQAIDPPFTESFEGQRRQELTPLYLREGSVYLCRTAVLMEQNSLKGQNCLAWMIPETRACNIDTPFDLFLASQYLKFNDNEPASHIGS